ncbi:MAG: response regulator [Phycisphaerae bacterium]|nr:response regulator [Phycisphaerae bacterium]
MGAKALRLDSHSLTQLLNELDAQPCPAGHRPDLPAEPQYPYRARSLYLDVRRTGGETNRVVVHARAISQHGLAVLAPRSIPLGTPCDVYPIDTTGGWQVCKGEVGGCAPLNGHADIWDLCIRLVKPIDVVRYAPGAWRTKVLVVDDSPAICTLMRALLPKYDADVVCVQSGQEAVEEGLNNCFDLVMLDIEMPGMNGIEVAQTLRKRGCIQPIVVVSATSEEENRDACIAVGCDSFVSKPITVEQISELVHMVRPPPLVSALDDDPASHELVDTYVARIRGTIEHLMEAFASADRKMLSMLCRHICAEAPSCGFPSLLKLAVRVIESVEAGFPMSDVRRPLCGLVRNLRAARPASNFEPILPQDASGCPMSALV